MTALYIILGIYIAIGLCVFGISVGIQMLFGLLPSWISGSQSQTTTGDFVKMFFLCVFLWLPGAIYYNFKR